MRLVTALWATALLLAACIVLADAPAEPCSKPAATATAPAVDPAAMKVLKRLEAAGSKHPNVAARLDYLVDMLQAGERERRAGTVYYQAARKDQPAKFRIHFDTLRQDDGPRIRNVVDYVFDGAWLTVRKERIKQETRYQLPPGKNVNPRQLGKGPFPVPFGQKAETVLEFFAVSTRPTAKADPPKTDYLKLVTRKRSRRDLSVKWMEMWVRQDGLPMKIIAEDRSENRTTVVFDKIETPKEFPKKTFDLPAPPRGWELRIERFKGRVK
jgi:hypothetical protein